MDANPTTAEPGTDSRAHDDNAADLLAQVGARVRHLRARRGMTRRNLSLHAKVSERYLGQLENGQANATLGLLQRIAQTLNEPLAALLPLDDGPGPLNPGLASLLAGMSESQQADAYRLLLRSVKRSPDDVLGVALIGMRGAGKTTLGRALAERRGVDFVRISDIVQDLGGMAIGEMLEMTGHSAYRRQEYEALEHIIARKRPMVVETGGGLVTEARTFDLLLRHFQTVWIAATPEEHMQRVVDQGDMRPMAGNERAMDDLRAILRERDGYYRQADHVVNTSRRTVADCLDELDRLTAAAFAHEPR